uniref:Uncharacterized protein n=1 Tax=Anguilla anguilla TaxID=7936 RepID=A0A0E9TGR1_ANGAN
MMAATMNSYE